MYNTMKNPFVFCCLLVVLLCCSGSLRANTVPVTLPPIEVLINDTNIDSTVASYPFLFYNNIVYFPLTYINCQNLGLDVLWDDYEGLSVFRVTYRGWNEDNKPLPLDIYGTATNTSTDFATLPDCRIRVNGSSINSNRAYPFFSYRDVLYMPLTWDFIVDAFNWDYAFSSGTLRIGMKPENYGASPYSSVDPSPYWLRAAGHNDDVYFYQALEFENTLDGVVMHDKLYRVANGMRNEIFELPAGVLFHADFLPWREDTLFQGINHAERAMRNSYLIRHDGSIGSFAPSGASYVLADEGAVLFLRGYYAPGNNLRWRTRDAVAFDDNVEIADANLFFQPKFLDDEAFVLGSWVYLTALTKDSPHLARGMSETVSEPATHYDLPYALGDGIYKVHLHTGECVLLQDFSLVDKHTLRYSDVDGEVIVTIE